MAGISQKQAPAESGLSQKPPQKGQAQKAGQGMKEAPMLGKKSNEKPDKAAPAIDLAMPLIDIRQDAAEQDAQEKKEFAGREKRI